MLTGEMQELRALTLYAVLFFLFLSCYQDSVMTVGAEYE